MDSSLPSSLSAASCSNNEMRMDLFAAFGRRVGRGERKGEGAALGQLWERNGGLRGKQEKEGDGVTVRSQRASECV